VQELVQEHERIVLAGYFCIFNADISIEVLPESVYHALNISQIVLLKADTQIIIDHLKRRDSILFAVIVLEVFQGKYSDVAIVVIDDADLPLFGISLRLFNIDLDVRLYCSGPVFPEYLDGEKARSLFDLDFSYYLTENFSAKERRDPKAADAFVFYLVEKGVDRTDSLTDAQHSSLASSSKPLQTPLPMECGNRCLNSPRFSEP
jgi:hypothetical protein